MKLGSGSYITSYSVKMVSSLLLIIIVSLAKTSYASQYDEYKKHEEFAKAVANKAKQANHQQVLDTIGAADNSVESSLGGYSKDILNSKARASDHYLSLKETVDKRPQFKHLENEYSFKQAELIADNAEPLIKGGSNRETNCQGRSNFEPCQSSYVENEGENGGKSLLRECKIEYVTEQCNEEIRQVKRVCDQVSEVEVVTINTIYPACYQFDYKSRDTRCNGGWATDLTSGLASHSDHIRRVCSKPSIGGDCFTKKFHFVGKGNDGDRALAIPKGHRAKLRAIDVWYKSGKIGVVAIDQRTGETLFNIKLAMNDVKDLPFSATEDRSIEFRISSGIGMVAAFVSYDGQHKKAEVNVREHCHDE